MMKLSVITVCFNAQDSIEKTIQSVIGQNYKNMEYLIIDGKSTDQTLDIVRKYKKECNYLRFISEEDTGIYNAMNKGISMAEGDYIYFLNSGDCFPDFYLAGQVMQEIEKHKPDIFYGNVDMDYGAYRKRIQYAKYKRLKKVWIALGITVCHQAVFAKADVLKKHNFDETFKLWADQEWMMRLLNEGVKVESKSMLVCIYDGFGQSSLAVNLELVFEESDRITKKYAPSLFYITKPMKFLLRIYRRVQKRRV